MVTLNPKPEVFTSVPDKFKRQIFLNNVMRVKALLMDFVALCKFVESCLEWENFLQSILALVAFLLSDQSRFITGQTVANDGGLGSLR